MVTLPATLTFLLMLATTDSTHYVTAYAVNHDVTAYYDGDICFPENCVFNETGSVLNCADLGCSQWEADNSTGSAGSDEPLSPWLQRLLAAKHILLSGNRLSRLMSLIPFGATLTTIDASHNAISSIVPDAFFLSDGLTDIDLSANRLTIDSFRWPTSLVLFGLVNLRRLDLSDNELDELSERDMFSSVRTTLEQLNLSGNRISMLVDNALTDLVVLESLDLSRNHIRSLTRDSFLGLSRLRRLDLSDNQLTSLVDELFGQCGRLESIDLRRNSIRRVSPDAFLGLQGLLELYLDDNELPDGVPAALPSSLQVLTLDGSARLTIVTDRALFVEEGVGRSPSSLEYISIRRCQLLTAVEAGAFGRLKRLTTVELSDNPKLTTIEVGTFDDTRNDELRLVTDADGGSKRSAITVLNLSGNALSGLDEKVLNWTSVSAFDFSANAWICDCRLEWMHRIQADNNSLSTIVCHWPLHLRGQSFFSDVVRSTTLSCSLTFVFRYQSGIGLLVVASMLFTVVSVVLVVRCRRALLPRCFDADGEYHTLYDVSESTISLNRISGDAVDAAEESALGVESVDEDDDDELDETVSTTTSATRPLRPIHPPVVTGSARGSANVNRKKRRNTSVDV